MTFLFRTVIAAGAFLLFLVQPMYARRLLPSLGGSPAVWNTALVFFQTSLLAGYTYAHVLTRRTTLGRSVAIHAGLLVVAVVVPAMGSPGGQPPSTASGAIPWLLWQMTVGIAPAFVVLSATSPLLQSWYAAASTGSDDRDAGDGKSTPDRGDPYFLYAASNLGSFGALIAYPVLVEPWLSVQTQIVVWRSALAVLAGGMVTAGIVAMRRCGENVETAKSVEMPPELPIGPPTRPSRRGGGVWVWLLASAVGSAWLLAVTTHLTMDIAPVPLLWVVPLGLYLLSFVIVFAERPLAPPTLWSRMFPGILIALVAFQILAGTWQPALVHLLVFFVGILAVHGRLADTRPPAHDLTRFYWLVSAGGVVGGAFTAIVAPIIFPTTLEYGLAIAAAGWVMSGRNVAEVQTSPPEDRRSLGRVEILTAVGVAVLTAGLSTTMRFGGTPAVAYAVLIAVPVMLAAWFLGMPRTSVVLGGGVMLLAAWQPPIAGRLLATRRSPFGVHRVIAADRLGQTRLLHGTTVHGIQDRRRPDR